MSWTKLLGVTLGTLGVAAMIGIDIDRGVGGSTILAMVACLAAALSYGFATVYGRRFRAHGLEPLTIAFGQVTASTLMILPIALSVDRPWTLPTPSSTGVAAVLALALLSTALAYVVFFRILERGGATNISLVTLLIPVSATLLGTAILGERLSANHFGGMAVVFLGLLILDGRLWEARPAFLRRRAPEECPESP